MTMRTSYPLFPDLLDALDEGVMVIGTDRTIRLLNRRASELLGTTSPDALGRPCAEVCRSPFCEQGCPVAAALAGEVDQAEDFELERHREREAQLLRVHSVALRDDHGRMTGAMAILRESGTLTRSPPGRDLEAGFAGLIGHSRPMRKLYSLIDLVARTGSTVLIQGETGTGKERIAEAIHQRGPRANRPLIRVNCSALPESLLESELFGYTRGAFTHAIRDKPGRFELADSGTLFLDEIGELSLAVQVKLLRVLERREFERVGGTRTQRTDVCILAATNKNLAELVARGQFREDLFYRLNIFPIQAPPLRDRLEDLPDLVTHFLGRLQRRWQRPLRGVADQAIAALAAYPWPGNVRELQNVLEYAAIVCRGEWIGLEHLPPHLSRPGTPEGTSDRARILDALERHHWRMQRAAASLGIDRTTLWRKMRQLAIQRPG